MMGSPGPPILAADDEAAVSRAAAILSAGGLVAVPTETVYGLCARAADPRAVAAVFAAKGRPAHNPLIVHGADAAMLERLGEFGETARALASAFWPGPLTLVVTMRPGAELAPAACPGGETVALRVPARRVFREIAQAVGPLVAPSANLSGRLSPTTAQDVAQELGGAVDLIIDGGACEVGVESTVVDATGAPRILRPGAIGPADLEPVVGPVALGGPPLAGEALRAPGLLASHYAPRAAVRLDVAAHDVRPGEAFLAFGGGPMPQEPAHTFNLSPGGDLAEAARHLYAGLRALDATGAEAIAVAPIPGDGLGAAIRDRLSRAAAPRPAERAGKP